MSLTNKIISSLLPPDLQLVSSTQIASLWLNYGYIYRLKVSSSDKRRDSHDHPRTLILKSIHPPSSLENASSSHSESESNIRKLLSYAVERWFYAHLSPVLSSNPGVKLARSSPLRADSEHTLLLEDLSVEFPFPAVGSLGRESTECVLRWLAGFHRAFHRVHQTRNEEGRLESVPAPLEWVKTKAEARGEVKGVWKRGTYWYLDTRREELGYMLEDEEYGWLIPWVEKVDKAIEREIETHGTLVHGDVKGANIVFNYDPYPRTKSKSKSRITPSHKSHSFPETSSTTPSTESNLRCALYDFQYVGLNLPTHDLVYFLGTSVQSSLLKTEDDERALLRVWLDAFTSSSHGNQGNTEISPSRTDVELDVENTSHNEYDFETLWRHWELSILDWYRFMAGWGFWGNDQWVERRAREIVESRRVEKLC